MSYKSYSIGILGGKGMLGSDLVRFLGERHSVTAIDTDNYEALRESSFDILINANGNSRRFWADEHPYEDFEASAVSVYRALVDFSYKRYIYISSSDVYADHTGGASTREDVPLALERLSPYGFHKALAEQMVRNRASDWLILRSSLILGKNLVKGPFFDIRSGHPLFITLDSRLAAITTNAVAEVIETLVRGGARREIFNMGGAGTFDFNTLGDIFSKPVAVAPDARRQHYAMDVAKLAARYPLKTSREYVEDFFRDRQ